MEQTLTGIVIFIMIILWLAFKCADESSDHVVSNDLYDIIGYNKQPMHFNNAGKTIRIYWCNKKQSWRACIGNKHFASKDKVEIVNKVKKYLEDK